MLNLLFDYWKWGQSLATSRTAEDRFLWKEMERGDKNKYLALKNKQI